MLLGRQNYGKRVACARFEPTTSRSSAVRRTADFPQTPLFLKPGTARIGSLPDAAAAEMRATRLIDGTSDM
jgi:hypothetical protein